MGSKAWRAVATFTVLVLVIAGCRDRDDNERGVTVMTQNVYVGFDAAPLLGTSDPQEIPVLAAQAFAQLQATNFPERAEAIADEIARRRPHLVGLQEVSLIRIQSPGDAVAGGTVPAEAVYLDYLDVLLDALAARGLDYRVAGTVQNVDIELPMLTNPDPLAFDDVRLTDFDVVLARGDVSITNVATGHYQATLPLAHLGAEVPRGYVAVDAHVRRNEVYRFVTTHLEDEPFLPVQLAQAEELAAMLASETKPVILVGDFNSPAPGGDTCLLLGASGFVDAWSRNLRAGEGEGMTWGHDADLLNATASFTVRIDLILVRPGAGAVWAEVWGDDPADKTPSGLWPSDHAAVIAELRP
jgi:hypothetical protein